MIRCQLVASKSKIVIPKTRVTSPRIVNYESLIALNSRLLSRLPASRFGPFISTHTHDPRTRAWLVLYYSRFFLSFLSFFSFLFFQCARSSLMPRALCLQLVAAHCVSQCVRPSARINATREKFLFRLTKSRIVNTIHEIFGRPFGSDENHKRNESRNVIRESWDGEMNDKRACGKRFHESRSEPYPEKKESRFMILF